MSLVTLNKIKIKIDENSEWKDAIEVIIHNYDAIQVILNYDGEVINEYYDEKRSHNKKQLWIK